MTAATATVAPEKTTIYEAGTKWNVLNQRLTLTGALYQMQMANVRETDPNNPLADILAGNYRVRGMEVSATGQLTDRWSIFGGYSYNDATWFHRRIRRKSGTRHQTRHATRWRFGPNTSFPGTT